MEKRKTLLGCLAVIGAQIFYGCSFLFTKTATETADPMDLLSWRFLVAFALMSIPVLTKLVRVSYRGKHLWKLLRTVALHPVCYFLCETYGILRTTASESGTIIASIPIFTILCATLIYELFGPVMTKIALTKAGEIPPKEKKSKQAKSA